MDISTYVLFDKDNPNNIIRNRQKGRVISDLKSMRQDGTHVAPAEYALLLQKDATKSAFKSELILSKNASSFCGTMTRGISPKAMWVGDVGGGEGGGEGPAMERKRFHSSLDGDEEVRGAGGE